MSTPISVVYLGNEVSIQSRILEIVPEQRTLFMCPLRSSNGGEVQNIVEPTTPFVAIADIECFPIDELVDKIPWLGRAEVWLLRAGIGSFWTGELDLKRLADGVSCFGFQLSDAIDWSGAFYLRATSERVALAFERAPCSAIEAGAARYRTLEALTYLSNPIAQRGDFQLLAGRGSYGFPGGLFNPGAIAGERCTYLVPQGERTPWALQKMDESRFFTSSSPVLVTLDEQGGVSTVKELETVGLKTHPTRAGDFRLVKFRGELLSNHFLVSSLRAEVVTNGPLRIDQMKVRVGLSKLDIEEARLTWVGFPILDRPLAYAEKNWVMFTDGDRLFLLYSIAPYVLLESADWPGLSFRTVLEARCALPFDGDGLGLRNSVNPVDYDDAHWLHIVHKVYPFKQYSFWAVLIDKKSLRPVRATARPLVCGSRSYAASIIYACSVIARESEVILYAGLDDSAMAVARIPRARLDAELVEIPKTNSN
jgi:hypothetical protein